MIRFIFAFLGLFCILIFSCIFIFISKLPNREKLNSCFTTTMFQIEVCSESKNYTRLNEISDNFEKAVIISEDAAFYSHKGFDWNSLKSTFEKNIEKKKIIRGGSTITQQLAKNLFFTGEKSISRKLLEMIYTAKIESELKKSEILEKYLNVIELGDQIFGVRAASNYYFSKEPKDLTLVESSFLAMLLPNPKKYVSSFKKKSLSEFAYQRIFKILNDLYSMNKITEVEFQNAQLELKTFLNGFHGTKSKDSAEEINELEESTI